METVFLRGLSDTELIDESVSGCPEAFAEIIRRNQRSLHLVARRCAQYDSDVDDIVQDALLKAHRHLAQFRGECGIRTWLQRLVAHAAYDHRTRTRKREYPFLDHPEVGASLTASLASNPFEDIDTAMTVRAAVALLPEEFRRAVELVDLRGMPVERAAAELGVAPGTVKSRRSRARALLRQALTSQGAVVE